MFGRRKREDVARAEETREAERRALFEQLARRPEHVCPFLGLASDRAGYQPEPNAEHRCYAFGDPAPLSDEQQRHVCLERGYSNCPRYLRGVLVIPTEELEALRRPQPHVPLPPPPPPKLRPASERPARRPWMVVLPLLLVFVAAVGAGGWYVFGRNSGVAILPTQSATPSTIASPTAGATGSSSALVTPTPLPTPNASDTFVAYQVGVGPETYELYAIDDAGNVTRTLSITFGRFSHARVQPVTAANGLRHWRTVDGGLAGYSYIAGQSGAFQIRKLYHSPNGQEHAIVIPPDQL